MSATSWARATGPSYGALSHTSNSQYGAWVGHHLGSGPNKAATADLGSHRSFITPTLLATSSSVGSRGQSQNHVTGNGKTTLNLAPEVGGSSAHDGIYHHGRPLHQQNGGYLFNSKSGEQQGHVLSGTGDVGETSSSALTTSYNSSLSATQYSNSSTPTSTFTYNSNNYNYNSGKADDLINQSTTTNNSTLSGSPYTRFRRDSDPQKTGLASLGSPGQQPLLDKTNFEDFGAARGDRLASGSTSGGLARSNTFHGNSALSRGRYSSRTDSENVPDSKPEDINRTSYISRGDKADPYKFNSTVSSTVTRNPDPSMDSSGSRSLMPRPPSGTDTGASRDRFLRSWTHSSTATDSQPGTRPFTPYRPGDYLLRTASADTSAGSGRYPYNSRDLDPVSRTAVPDALSSSGSLVSTTASDVLEPGKNQDRYSRTLGKELSFHDTSPGSTTVTASETEGTWRSSAFSDSIQKSWNVLTESIKRATALPMDTAIHRLSSSAPMDRDTNRAATFPSSDRTLGSLGTDRAISLEPPRIGTTLEPVRSYTLHSDSLSNPRASLSAPSDPHPSYSSEPTSLPSRAADTLTADFSDIVRAVSGKTAKKSILKKGGSLEQRRRNVYNTGEGGALYNTYSSGSEATLSRVPGQLRPFPPLSRAPVSGTGNRVNSYSSGKRVTFNLALNQLRPISVEY